MWIVAVVLYLSSLVFYNRTKDREWTDAWGKLTLARPRATNDYFLPTERWAAYVFPGTGWGVGVYSPNSDVVTAYRLDVNGVPDASSEREIIRSGHPLAGYVAPDLQRWQDWSAVPDYAGLIRTGAWQQPASSYAMLGYLSSAPGPEARAAVAALKKGPTQP